MQFLWSNEDMIKLRVVMISLKYVLQSNPSIKGINVLRDININQNVNIKYERQSKLYSMYNIFATAS